MTSKDTTQPANESSSRPLGFYPGLVLDGRYRLQSILGAGGMGTVWQASQLALDRQVAVKSLQEHSSTFRARLRQEALALAAVHHPAVVQVYDYGENEDGLPYVVMELVRGESIGSRLHRLGACSAQEAVRLLLPLLNGLAAAHAVGVVHRDIKPENVILVDSANGPTAKLIDFGIARIDKGASQPAAAITMVGSFVGTPAYTAPEQMRNAFVDERVDVWGMGILLYELIANTPPFAAQDVYVLMRQVLEDVPPYPQHAVGLDGRLWSILMSALRKLPGDRLPSASAFHTLLETWLRTAPQAPPRWDSPKSLQLAPEDRAFSAVEATLPLAPAYSPGVNLKRKEQTEEHHKEQDDDPPSLDGLIRAKLGD